MENDRVVEAERVYIISSFRDPTDPPSSHGKGDVSCPTGDTRHTKKAPAWGSRHCRSTWVPGSASFNVAPNLFAVRLDQQWRPMTSNG